MFREMSSSFIKRDVNTCQPRFKRINRDNTPSSQIKIPSHRNFPSVNRGSGFDNSKQNLFYESHLTKVRSACKLDETTIVSKYLNTIRKDYDEMSKVGRRQLNSMKLKKREIDFIRQRNKIYEQKRQQIQKLIQIKQRQTGQIRIKYEDSKMQTKTLQHIISRMKRDEIFYKQYGRIRDEQLKRKIKQLKLNDEILIHEQQKVHKLLESLNEYRNLYNKNHDLRQKKYQDYYGKISDVKQRDRFLQQRKQRTYQLQSIQLNDTLDQKNIHMRQIILAHRVADSLLQCKVNTLIKQYSDIQSAFHIVKIKTGITQPHLLTTKFFSYEQTAQELLQSITQNQAKIQQLTNKKNQLSQTYRNLMNEGLSAVDTRQFDKTCDKQISQKKQQYLRQINDKKLLVDQIVNWVEKRLQDFSCQKYPREIPFQKKFQELCQFIRQNSKKYQNYDLTEHKTQLTGIRLKKLVKQLTAQQISLRIRQTQQMNESNIIEQQFIQTSRQNIMKKGFSIKHFKRQSGNYYK